MFTKKLIVQLLVSNAIRLGNSSGGEVIALV
jgi:hypothetical protein